MSFPRIFVIAIVSVLVSGCSLPISAQIASLVADGVSLIATDKTITDHGISMAANKDCAIWRGISGDEFCRDNNADGEKTMAIAKKDKSEKTPTKVASVASKTIPDIKTNANPAPVLSRPAPVLQNNKDKRQGLYFVLASFSIPANAKRLVLDNANFSPLVVNAKFHNGVVHRVVVGPFTPKTRKPLRRRLVKAGFTNAWTLRLKTNEYMGESRQLLAALP